jgi:hypothetical protein
LKSSIYLFVCKHGHVTASTHENCFQLHTSARLAPNLKLPLLC